jgi:hypothetical protein
MRTLLILIPVIFLLTSGCEPKVIERIIPTDYDPHAIPCPKGPLPLYDPGKMLFGRVAGLKNCQPFMSSAWLHLHQGGTTFFGIEAITYRELLNTDFRREILTVGSVDEGLGYSPFTDFTSDSLAFPSYKIITDSNSVQDIYTLDEAFGWNGITYTHLDFVKPRIEGVFQCRFLLDQSSASGLHPDTILFTECYFIAEGN